ncbi:MAG: 16S rRNA (adenine(1518)-N(6)/adenine(1519)-N(6))-dimethyltransferase RsmA [Candidatus Moranbacteria bacterium]|nr:16S rRNA (adenine(1518)-N(6)/adenine(1519)-N(6))-dimethyltransferase RsmA [Candidatus Moranbacteria bacterium]
MKMPKKSLGQNFLQDKEVLEKIIEAGDIKKSDKILEIGSGEGVLTKRLAGEAGVVLALEKDEALAESLRRNNYFKNVEILIGDVLDINLPKLLKRKDFHNYKLIANIPYYITGKIFRLFLETSAQPDLLVLLVQKEVAERVCAKPGKMNLLATAVQYFGKPEIISQVSRESFYPRPEVDSAILKISPRGKYRYKNEKKEKNFLQLVRIGFSSPRKTLINNLKAGFSLEREELEKIFEKLNLPKDVRAQNLKIEDWQNLEKEIYI